MNTENKKLKICVVDDEALNRFLLQELLQDDFNIDTLVDGQACLDYIKDNIPDLFLLDVNMPGIDGLETCRQIKSNPKTEKIPVIFISALSLPHERLAGYEAGGDDYIPKPFDELELQKKINQALENYNKLLTHDNELEEAKSMALMAMTQASEMGNILRFFQETFYISDIDSIISKMMALLKSYGFQSVISVMLTGQEEKMHSSNGVINPLERSVIKQLQTQERIFSFGKRTIFNYGDISVLILNMPIDNEEMYGRIKDDMAILCDGINARLKAIETELELERQRSHLVELVHNTHDVIQAIEQAHIRHQNDYTEITNKFMDDIEDSFRFLALEENQENTLEALIRKNEENIRGLFDRGAEMEDKITAIRQLLEKPI